MSSTRAPRSRTSAVNKAANAGKGSRNIWIIAAVVVIVAFAGIMAIALSQEDGGGSGDQTAAVTVSGDPLPPLGAGEAGTAPELAGTSFDGTSVEIGNDGRPKVIGFFAHWCPHCQAEVPEVAEWANAGNMPDDVDLYAVSTDVNPAAGNYPPSAWFDRLDWPIPTMMDDNANTAARAFGLTGYPFWVAVDADGNVVDRRSGRIGTAELEALIEMTRGES
jgi:cytochrome c biogenesis protein CcmG/thiol:disulfide interchange protein DsbE